MPAREAALARGFVLGEDEEIDAATKEDFRRSGLSHLLAVSGQNVTLLALLAMPLLGAFGIPLRERLRLGAGADRRLRAAGRRRPLDPAGGGDGRRSACWRRWAAAAPRASTRWRWRPLVTLAIDPGIAADVGWQLSFAAVLGILLLARAAAASALVARLGAGRLAPRPRRGGGGDRRRDPGDGAADRLPLRNALDHDPRRQRAGAAGGGAGDVAGHVQRRPGAGAGRAAGAAERPQRPAARLHRPGRRLVRGAGLGRARGPPRRRRAGRRPTSGSGWARAGLLALAAGGAGARRRSRRPAGVPARPGSGGDGADGPPSRGLRVEVLDVGQGDAILLQPAARPGRPRRRRPARRRPGGASSTDAGVERLGGGDRHPRPVRPRRRDRGAARAACRSSGCSSPALGRGADREGGRGGRRAGADRGGSGAALRRAAAAGPLAAAGAARRRRRPGRTRISWRW